MSTQILDPRAPFPSGAVPECWRVNGSTYAEHILGSPDSTLALAAEPI